MVRAIVVILAIALLNVQARASDNRLLSLSLEELLAVEITSTSFFDETLLSSAHSVNPKRYREVRSGVDIAKVLSLCGA